MKAISSSGHASSNTKPSAKAVDGLVKELLVPIDFSPASVSALRAAVQTARRENAHLTLCNVVEGGVFYRGLEVPGWQHRRQERQARQLQRLAEDEIPSPMEVDFVVSAGEPVNEINRIAGLRHMDCIMVGRKNPNGNAGGFHHHTARRIAASAPCPVVVVTDEKTATNQI